MLSFLGASGQIQRAQLLVPLSIVKQTRDNHRKGIIPPPKCFPLKHDCYPPLLCLFLLFLLRSSPLFRTFHLFPSLPAGSLVPRALSPRFRSSLRPLIIARGSVPNPHANYLSLGTGGQLSSLHPHVYVLLAFFRLPPFQQPPMASQLVKMSAECISLLVHLPSFQLCPQFLPPKFGITPLFSPKMLSISLS